MGLGYQRWAGISLCLIALSPNADRVLAQDHGRSSARSLKQQADTLVRVTAIRDDFMKRVRSLGQTCALNAPAMVVQDVVSFGAYDEATNTVTTTDWAILGPRRKEIFFQMAGPGADETAARSVFEETMHRWMLVHELTHWWQTCKRKKVMSDSLQPFEVGLESDRITLAYWQEADPALPPKIRAVTQGLIGHAPNPVPDGQNFREYFDATYPHLSSSVMPWFAAQMILAAMNERPETSLAQALVVSSR